MKNLTAFVRHANPKFRTKVVVSLHPSFFVLDSYDKRRFGNLAGKINSVATELAGGRLHHYTLA